MSACEWCWQEAQRRVWQWGGTLLSVTDCYDRVLREQAALGEGRAQCPKARGTWAPEEEGGARVARWRDPRERMLRALR
jgi:hypothetical protein